MKCSNPDCNRGIGLVAYRRGRFGKRRYCSRNCRDAVDILSAQRLGVMLKDLLWCACWHWCPPAVIAILHTKERFVTPGSKQ
jgi:hypothetical protein